VVDGFLVLVALSALIIIWFGRTGGDEAPWRTASLVWQISARSSGSTCPARLAHAQIV
jgi:hypothetical protein